MRTADVSVNRAVEPSDALVVVGSRTYKRTTVKRAAELRERFDPPWDLTGETSDYSSRRPDRAGMIDIPLRLTAEELYTALWSSGGSGSGGFIKTRRFAMSGYCEYEYVQAEVMIRFRSKVWRFESRHADVENVTSNVIELLLSQDAIELVPSRTNERLRAEIDAHGALRTLSWSGKPFL